MPSVHVPHDPLLHTMFVPHVVPFILFPPSTHVCAPVAHEVTPFLHTFGFVVHASPAAHATQVPEPLQTMSVPQLVPGALLPPSMQVCVPVEQLVIPFLQAFGFVVHAVPAVHATHVPALHTMPVPQPVPFPLLVVSLHTGKPVAQAIVPFLHAFGGWQAMLIVHAPQTPSLQTMFVPHDVPFGLSPVTLQTIVPVVHAFAPVLH